MSNSDFQIQTLNVRDASQAEYAALNRHTNRIRLERLPNDPPIPLQETINNLQSLPPFVDVPMWVVWTSDQSEIVAMGDLVLIRMEDNQHLAQFDLSVVADHRRKGLGRRLFALIAEAAQRENRRLLMTNTVDRLPGGQAFMTRIGAKKGLETHTNQLVIADLKTGLIDDWLVRGGALNEQFELGLWEGSYPEEKIQTIVELYDLTNQQPLGDLDVEDMHMTAEQLRQVEQNIFARGYQRWTFYVVERATGKFAGYTENIWNPNRPEVHLVEMTGVFPEYRGKGLGRWLKAAMLDKIIKARPEVKYVRTGNADSNAAMLKINHELGFKPYMAEAIWQVEIEKVLEYLKQ